MEYGKYIIKKIKGIRVAIMFDCLITHSDMGTKGESRGEIISAGFFGITANPSDKDRYDLDVEVWGESISLKLHSRKEDALFIKKVVRPEL